MKKSQLKKIAMVGIATGLIVSVDISALSFGPGNSLSKHIAANSCRTKPADKDKKEDEKKNGDQTKTAAPASARSYLSAGSCAGKGGCQSKPQTPATTPDEEQNGSQAQKRHRAYLAQQNIEENSPASEGGDDEAIDAGKRSARIRLYAESQDDAQDNDDDDDDDDDVVTPNQNRSVNGTKNGVQYAMLHDKEGELSESRLISQLSKENLDLYRKLSYEDKALVRKLAKEMGEANQGFQKALEQINAKTGSKRK